MNKILYSIVELVMVYQALLAGGRKTREYKNQPSTEYCSVPMRSTFISRFL